jgi:hypothetical protein
MTTKSCTLNFLVDTYERNTSMNNFALRSDCSSARPMLVLVLIKNVRDVRTMFFGVEFCVGLAILQGLKPGFLSAFFGTAEAVP